MRRISTWIIVGLAVFALAFLAAPWFAFRALRADARDQDVQGLAQVVDFPAVRASLRPQVRELTAKAPPPDLWTDPVGAVRHALEPIDPAPPAIDRYLTPAGLHALSLGQAPPRAGARAPVAGRAPFPVLRFWGVRRVRFAVTAPPRGPTVFTFARRGLFTWRLVHIKLPEDGE
jgi:hypothetical protein